MSGDIKVFEHTKQLKNLNMRRCFEITGKKFLGKFFADQSSQKFAGSFLPGDIKVFEHTKDLEIVTMYACTEISGKKFLG